MRGAIKKYRDGRFGVGSPAGVCRDRERSGMFQGDRTVDGVDVSRGDAGFQTVWSRGVVYGVHGAGEFGIVLWREDPAGCDYAKRQWAVAASVGGSRLARQA